jgi:hypothetical protein
MYCCIKCMREKNPMKSTSKCFCLNNWNNESDIYLSVELGEEAM